MYYSIRNRNIQRKNKRNTLIYFFLSIALVVIFSFVGIKVLVKVINVITDIKKSDTSQSSTDHIPPMIPSVESLPEYTSNSSVEIKGNAEAGSSITLIFNGNESDSVVGSDGTYVFKKTLEEGLNELYLFSKDLSGNSSQNTKVFKITFDKTTPEIDIKSPSNGTTFYGFKNKIAEIKGNTEGDATVTVNDKYVYVSDDGSFNCKYDLSNGENKITFKAVDPSGNEATKEITLYYQD